MSSSSSLSSSCAAPRSALGAAAEAGGPCCGLLRAKLGTALALVAQLFNGRHTNIALLQVWFRDPSPRAPKDPLQAEYHADPELALMSDPSFDGFRTASAQCRDCGRLSMPGRVFRSGAVQVVQDLRVLPSCLHPRSRLSGALEGRVGAALYLPVYDLARPEAGPVAVLEALLSPRAADSMLVANLMSFVASQLAAMQLSVSSPLPQPVLPSSLAGRRPRPPADLTDSDEDDDDDDANGETWPALPPAPKLPRRGAAPRHPAMAAPPPAAVAAAAAVAQAACGGPSSCGLGESYLTCSGDSACTVSAGGADASCGAFPRRAASPAAAGAATPAGSAATAPAALCRPRDVDDDGGDCGGMGPPRSKRPRFGGFGAAAAAGMRRTQSVPRSLSDLLREGQGEAAPAAAAAQEEL
ncbi:hypothetical protein Rsub_07991 [Raphidocelis subcapitata]|uniref:Uncharacterized protein n=1 Tax=Raphidocelis subcapitata TaxID=307507 RepID=A0A2V0P5H4_9CHLO|nr:hypothetical protein Rsub_07991 [Raphidocelis subcapitata]|eukprot:GBF94819.1 hypothetical protein Rsub_07991 [Raphidocelis subcapitata]